MIGLKPSGSYNQRREKMADRFAGCFASPGASDNFDLSLPES